MALTPLLNLVIPKGSDLSDLTFQLRHKCVTRCATKASLTPSTIKVEPMGVTMLAGSTISIGCDDLTLATDLAPSDRLIQVSSIPSAIPNQAIVIGPPINITGWTFNGAMKDKFGSLLANFVCTVTEAINGRFRVFLSKDITRLIPANCTWQDYQGINIESLGQPIENYTDTLTKETLKRLKKLNDVAYLWEVESVDDAGITDRRVQGLALVSGEVTT
jgi:hypothetical protein